MENSWEVLLLLMNNNYLNFANVLRGVPNVSVGCPLPRTFICSIFFLCKGYDMSTFIRRYSNYLTKKAHTYTEAGYDFCRVSRG